MGKIKLVWFGRESSNGSKSTFGLLFLLLLSVSGCSSVNFNQLSSKGPDFNFVDYFEGHTRASGWFADRFGNVKRHFCGDFYGAAKGDIFELDEVLFYSDGVIEKRVWDVSIGPDGQFSAESESLVGAAIGVQQGSGLHLHYIMNVMIADDKFWKLTMNDYMFYQPDRSLHNMTEVKKWGLRIGNVSTQYYKHDGSETCMAMQDKNTVSSRKLSIVRG